MADGATPYPGSETDPRKLFELAGTYRLAFDTLCDQMQKGPGGLHSPASFCGIHAIELYLQALLRMDGVCPVEARGFRHRLSDIAAHPSVAALALRKRTRDHLCSITQSREYLVVRYAPDLKAERSQRNQIEASLEDLARKIGARFNGSSSR